MGHDDDIILLYLHKFPGAYISPMEVCKRADSRKRFNENPDWAKPILAKMATAGVLEVNSVGHYRIRMEEEEEEPKKERREISALSMEDILAAAPSPTATAANPTIAATSPAESKDLPKPAASDAAPQSKAPLPSGSPRAAEQKKAA